MVIKQNKQQKRWKGKMSRMKQVKLLDIADIIMGQSPKSIFYNLNGEGLPFFQGRSEFGYIYPNIEKWCTKLLKVAKKDDVLMTVRAPVGDLNIAKEECIIGRGLCALRSKLNNGRFLYYLLKGNNNYITSFGSGAVYEAINKDSVENLVFNIPDELTQQKISSILSAYDDLIENNTRRIQILEEMAQRIYKEWFVDFRFPGHEKIKFIDSELGKIPEGWMVKKIEDILEYYIGGGWGKGSEETKHIIPAYVIRGTDIPNVRRGNIVSCPLRYHTELNFRSRELQKGDIIFEVSGGSKDQPVGRALLINEFTLRAFNKPVICASFCKLMRVDHHIISPELLYLKLLETYENKSIYKYQVQSTGISNFKFEYFINSETILVPSKMVKEKFIEIVEPIFNAITLYGQKNMKLIETRDLLLPKLISGELDVSDLDIKIREEKL